MLPRILGFCGAAGVGKSQAAEAVENACGHERTSFGAWLRDIAVACYDVDAGRLGDLKVKVRGGAVLTEDERNEMLWIRSELRRIGAGMKAIDRSCFTRPAMLFADQGITPRGPVQRTLRKEKDGLWYAKIVVDDVRWIEEIQAIKKRGGAVVRLVGPSLWGPSPIVEDQDLATQEFPEIDVSAAADATIALLRRAHPTPYAPFHARVLEGLEGLFGKDDELNLYREGLVAVDIDDEDDLAA